MVVAYIWKKKFAHPTAMRYNEISVLTTVYRLQPSLALLYIQIIYLTITKFLYGLVKSMFQIKLINGKCTLYICKLQVHLQHRMNLLWIKAAVVRRQILTIAAENRKLW